MPGTPDDPIAVRTVRCGRGRMSCFAALEEARSTRESTTARHVVLTNRPGVIRSPLRDADCEARSADDLVTGLPE